jgi:hypothetical protein
MDNADWFKTNLTITANATTSPDGTQNADLLDDGTASATQHWIYQGPAFSNSIAYTISFYAKYVSRKYMAVNIFNGSTSQYVTYDIQNGSVFGSTGDVTASMTNVGNGWYRVVYTRTMASSGSPNFRIALADDTGDVTYTGSNKQVYMWGAQLEASSYPTSYIPTTSASATRVADACFKTGISSLIGQTEGVIFYDGVLTGISNAFANLINSEKNTTGSFAIQQGLNNSIAGDIFVGGTRVVAIQGGNFSVGTRTKIAFAYKSGSSALYVNGTQIATSSATFTPIENMDDIYIGDETTYFSYKENTQVNQVALFKTRLTNAELASLTTI